MNKVKDMSPVRLGTVQQIVSIVVHRSKGQMAFRRFSRRLLFLLKSIKICLTRVTCLSKVCKLLSWAQ